MSYVTGRSIPPARPLSGPPETLPTMYDLPSEFPEEPGLPDVGVSPSRDVFHDLQPQLLSRTLSLVDYRRENWFTGTDLNLYYDADHPLWHKRPDWFLAVNVPRLYRGEDMRLSYVVWQWCDRAGNWLLTDTEKAEQQAQAERAGRQQAQQQAKTERLAREQAQQQAEQERLAREQAQQQAARLAARLRELGINPDDV